MPARAIPLPRRLALTIALSVALYLPYLLTNRFPLFTPRQLPLTALDQAIPFWPWTVFPYLLVLAGVLLPAFLPDPQRFTHALRAMAIGTLANNLVFALYPTTYPRPPLPAGSSLDRMIYHWIVILDTPHNCFPSAHITAPAIGCWALARQFPRWRAPIWAIFLTLSLSILTTKQHYAIDWLAGLATAAFGLALARRARWS